MRSILGGYRNNLGREALTALPAKLTSIASDVVPQLIDDSSARTAKATMSTLAATPSDRVRAKRDEIEHELKQCPDFQVYLIAKSRDDRARMERLLIQIPAFRLWCMLSDAVERARAQAATSREADRSGLRSLPGRLAAGESGS